MQSGPLDQIEAEIDAFFSAKYLQRESVVNFERTEHYSAILTRYGWTSAQHQVELLTRWALQQTLRTSLGASTKPDSH